MSSSFDQSAICTGMGVDAHRFAPEGSRRPLWLACLAWDGVGLQGESDGDVASHAVIDALLSAARLGDIGQLFGVGPHARGVGLHGAEMLRIAVRHIRAHGYRPSNASVVIVGNRPSLSPRRVQAEEAMSQAVGCPVSISATTTDGMGFTGAGEGLAAIANVLVVPTECA